VLLAGLVAGTVPAAVAGGESTWRDAPLALFGLTATCAAVVVAVRTIRTRIAVDDTGVEVCNPLRSHRIRWEEVVCIDWHASWPIKLVAAPYQVAAVRFRLHDGRTVHATATRYLGEGLPAPDGRVLAAVERHARRGGISCAALTPPVSGNVRP
jgi:hypothetical protein